MKWSCWVQTCKTVVNLIKIVVNYDSRVVICGYFQVKYDSKVVIYDHRAFIGSTTGDQLYSDPSPNGECSLFLRSELPKISRPFVPKLFILVDDKTWLTYGHEIKLSQVHIFSSIQCDKNLFEINKSVSHSLESRCIQTWKRDPWNRSRFDFRLKSFPGSKVHLYIHK